MKDRKQSHRERSARYRASHPEQIKIYNQEWCSKNPDYHLEYVKLKYKTDFNFRLIVVQRARIYQALRNNLKSVCTLELIGCTIAEWKQWLEFQFIPGMTWENYGSVWHVDHIRPCASFDFTDPEQQKECFHFANTQPLFALDNIKKGKKHRAIL